MAVVRLDVVRRRLEEIKARRLEEARRLGIYDMAVLVATELGSEFWKVHGSYHVFPRMTEKEFKGLEPRKYRLLIIYDDYGANVEVFYEGSKVFDVSLGEIALYVPGTWVNELINLYKTAKVEAAKKRVKAELEAIKKEAERWGVDPQQLLDDLGV